MRHLGKRAWAVLTMGLLIVPMSAASLAYACTGLATLSSSPGSGVAGETVTLNARGFAPHDPSDSRTGSLVELRMDNMDGPVIGTAAPAGSGNFSVQIKVPQVEPGEHVLIATQNRNDGRPSYGTPARTVLTVNPTPAPAAAGVQAAAPAAPPQAAPAPVAPTKAAPTNAAPAKAAPKEASKSNSRTTLARAVKRCTTRHNAKKAKTRVGKKRTAARRAACIKQAKRRASTVE